MIKNPVFSLRFILAVSLFGIGLASCQAQGTPPTLAPALPSPTSNPPTSIPPTIVPPSPTPIPTLTPVPSIQAQSLQDITGDWKVNCSNGPCLWQIKADGTFIVSDYYQGTIGVWYDWGKMTLAEGVFHLESTSVLCAATPNGYYQAFLTYKNGKPASLRFKSTQPDECIDRGQLLNLTLVFVNP